MHFDALRCFYTSQTDQASQETLAYMLQVPIFACCKHIYCIYIYVHIYIYTRINLFTFLDLVLRSGLRVLQKKRRVSFSTVSSSQQWCSEGSGIRCANYLGYDSV